LLGRAIQKRFNTFVGDEQTVKTVLALGQHFFTGLKPGVNERGSLYVHKILQEITEGTEKGVGASEGESVQLAPWGGAFSFPASGLSPAAHE
jgi:hypothetical protein